MVLWLCFYLQRLWEVARFIGLGLRFWDWWKVLFGLSPVVVALAAGETAVAVAAAVALPAVVAEAAEQQQQLTL